MTKDELIEALAAIEHQRWADWQTWVHQSATWVSYQDEEGSVREGFIIPESSWTQWECQISTPYADLSDDEQASDRREVMRYWPLIVDFVANWIEHEDHGDSYLQKDMAEDWRGEMGDVGHDAD